MINNPKVSVLIPVYNALKYLPRLINNLSNTTYKNCEFLLVDDLSTDGSYEYLKSNATHDSRFKILQVRKKGGTAVKAQIQAFSSITGDYYFFLSHDDFFDNELIEKMVDVAMQKNADIVLPNLIFFHENSINTKFSSYPINNDYNTTLDGLEAFEKSLNWNIHANALRKVDLFNKSGFDDKYFNSDEYYFRKQFLFSNKVAFANTNFYYNQDNPDAITKKISHLHIDIVLTDLMLTQLLIENKYQKKVVLKHLRSNIGGFILKSKLLFNKNFSINQKLYILKIMSKSIFKIIIIFLNCI